MRNAITSVNKWLSENLADANLYFAPGEPSELPAITVMASGASGVANGGNRDAMLAEVAFTADCISGGGNAAAARGLAAELTKLLLGDSDGGLKIPLLDWDYELPVPAPVVVLGEMTVSGITWEEIHIEKNPELKIVRVGFGVRAKLDGANLG